MANKARPSGGSLRDRMTTGATTQAVGGPPSSSDNSDENPDVTQMQPGGSPPGATQTTAQTETLDDVDREIRLGRLPDPDPANLQNQDNPNVDDLAEAQEYLASEEGQAETTELATSNDYADHVLRALRWTLKKLQTPSEQNVTCSQHGRVPLTHVCAFHDNADYVFAVKMAAGFDPTVEEDEDDGEGEED